MITVCPCCGHKFGGSLFEGCPSCGSQAVGEPLTRPERELPNYGRAVSLAAFGVVLALAFLVATGVALFTRQPLEFGFWNFMAAGETAAWQLKFIVAPLALLGALFGWRALQSMRNNPRFAGLPAAYSGVGLSAAMALLFAALIGVTVPERLRQSQLQQEAATQAIGFTFHRAQLEYRSRYGTYAASPDDLKRLPDADGSIAQAVAQVSERNYRPWSVQAAAPGGKTLTGAKVRPVSARVGVTEAVEGVSFTNYELRLPGPDKQMNTEDDWILRDGVMMKVTAAPVRAR